MDWTNFSFHCDDFGNSKTWWNNMIPNKNVEIVLGVISDSVKNKVGGSQGMMELVLKGISD